MELFGIRFILMIVAFSGWSMVAPFLIGFLLGGRSRAGCIVLPLLGITPILLVYLDAWFGGCFQSADCMVGFGMVLAVWPGVLWIVAALAGMALKWFLTRRRGGPSEDPPAPPHEPAPPS